MAVLILLSSLLALVYIWRVSRWPTSGNRRMTQPEIEEAPLSLLGPIWVLAGATLFFGVFTSLSAGAASAAARMLLGVGP